MKKKLKICVYAIAKNEEKFVHRWYNSIKEADNIYVLDTGSTDNTINILKELGVHVVQKIITPWRFDTARNLSLELVPLDTDICICLDLDEIIESGWRDQLEKLWTSDIARLSYPYTWSFDEFGNPAVNFYIEKIHARRNYYWTHPVHEVLTYSGKQENKMITDTITVSHYPDIHKSRRSYLPLLELSVKEDPQDDRNMHYLGREYMYYGYYKKAIRTLKKHLKLESATWKDERCASMRFIARCYAYQKDLKNANTWAIKAIKEAPYLRDPYMEKAFTSYEEKKWSDVIFYCLQALTITNPNRTYIQEAFCKNSSIYDLLSIAFYYQGLYEFSYLSIQEALKNSPQNPRLLENFKKIQEKRK